MSRLFFTKRPSKSGYTIVDTHLQAEIKKAVKVAHSSLREICGVIVSDGHRLHLVRLPNKAKQPCRFSLSWRSLRKAKKAARTLHYRLVGTFHSHPLSDAQPGATDIKGVHNKTLMPIIDCNNRTAKLWRIKKRKALPVPLKNTSGSE